jgi:hypothetical protein
LSAGLPLPIGLPSLVAAPGLITISLNRRFCALFNSISGSPFNASNCVEVSRLIRSTWPLCNAVTAASALR